MLAVCVSASGAAHAQTPNDPRARQAFIDGVAALRAQRFVEAMPLLEDAVRIDPTPTGRFNLALAYRGAGRIAAAIATFERYLEAPEVGVPEARLRAIRDELPMLLRSVARLRIDVSPPSATLRVDGRETALVHGELRIDPGTHVLELDAADHAPARREITAQAGMTMMLELRLQPRALATPPPTNVASSGAPPAAAPPPTGTLTLEPDVPGAVVSVDGASRGSGPLTLTLPAGEHRVLVTASGREPWSRMLHVVPGSSQRVSASLTTRGSNGWVLPVAIAGGAAVVTAVVIGVLAATRGDAEPTPASWAVVREP